MRPIIRIENLGKQYRLGASRSKYVTLRESLTRAAHAPLRWLRKERSTPSNTIWALKDVNCEIRPGEVVGIIGRNGAGKSTLLKTLSRITEPTTGHIDLYGRVGSLLEVGTGFHPELTGRENVFLNGAILGMRRTEIKRKFDDIVAFAEVEKFLDTPVKHYSSGMYVRLAFAVAAHLEPEILVVDEVLAVGDAGFQKKCLNKMEGVGKEGRTVLFVSHNMSAVRQLCTRGILFEEGRITKEGSIAEVTAEYLLGATSAGGERQWIDVGQAPGDDVVRLRAVRVKGADGEVKTKFSVRESLDVEIDYWVLKPNYPLNTLCYFIDEYGASRFVSIDNLDSPWRDTVRPVGLHRSVCHVPGDLLNEGTVRIHALVVTSPASPHAIEHDVLAFTVFDDLDTRGVRGNYPREWPAASVRPRLSWTVTRLRDIPNEERA